MEKKKIVSQQRTKLINVGFTFRIEVRSKSFKCTKCKVTSKKIDTKLKNIYIALHLNRPNKKSQKLLYSTLVPTLVNLYRRRRRISYGMKRQKGVSFSN